MINAQLKNAAIEIISKNNSGAPLDEVAMAANLTVAIEEFLNGSNDDDSHYENFFAIEASYDERVSAMHEAFVEVLADGAFSSVLNIIATSGDDNYPVILEKENEDGEIVRVIECFNTVQQPKWIEFRTDEGGDDYVEEVYRSKPV